jgi:hypothetical protein
MSEADNRDAANLVLLCITDAYLIDVDQGLNYPVPQLHEWKQAQLDEHQAVLEGGAPGGWPITDEQAEKIIRLSSTINIQADVVSFGGGGGNAPGSGGGGGGAVGTGTLISGRGGDVTINLDGQRGITFGAGGGGGGSVADGSIARPDDPIGTEGRGYVVGFDGEEGGDTAFGSGDLRVVAGGGEPGRTGSGDRKTTERLTLSALMLANYARIDATGLVIIDGGGWQWRTFLNLPIDYNLLIASIIDAGGAPPGEYTVQFEILNPAGERRGGRTAALAVEQSGDVVRIPAVFTVPVNIDMFGVWRVIVRSDLAMLQTLEFMIKRIGEAD